MKQRESAEISIKSKSKHIEKILNSETFRKHGQLQTILREIWKKTREGGLISSKDISNVLYKKSGYEKAVRVNVSKLREKLKSYYDSERRISMIKVELLKGEYRFEFKWRSLFCKYLHALSKASVRISSSIIIAIIIILFLLFQREEENPVDALLEGRTLKAVNKDGNVLWKYTQFEREQKLGKKRDTHLLIDDFTDDNLNEIIYAPWYEDKPGCGNEVFFFNSDGTCRWNDSAKVGRELRLARGTFKDSYDINFIKKVTTKSFEPSIMVYSTYHPGHPCFITLLNLKGETIGEFWNYGNLSTGPEYVDHDGDGKAEIFFGGLNGEYNEAVLVVFGHSRFSGKSPQTTGSEFDPLDLKKGTEKYYIRFSNSCLMEGKPWFTYAGREITEKDDHILVSVSEGIPRRASDIYYYFDKNMRFKREIKISNNFVYNHADMTEENRVSKSLEECKESLIDGVRYWDGERWTTEPSINKYFLENSN